MLTKTDVIIIGGGIIGNAIGYYLCKRGKKVALVEKDDFAAGASGACDQFVIMQSKSPGIHLEIAMASSRLYENLSKELDFETEHDISGGMVVIETEKEKSFMEKRVKSQQEAGLPVEILDIKEARKMQKNLSPDLVGAAYCPVDAHTNSIKVTEGFARNILKMGGEIIYHTRVTDVLLQGTEVKGVKTTRGEIHGEMVVNAAGAFAPFIGKMVGVDLPIKPRRGQLIITEAVAPFIACGMLSTKYIASKQKPEILEGVSEKFKELGVGLSLTQTRKGNIFIGATREFAGYDTSTTREGIKEIIKNALNIVPPLKELNMIRTTGGLRPYTPDGLPILGKVNGINGFIMAAGHEGDGIALAPITGKVVSQFICGEKTDFDMEQFSLNRFNN